jgi:cell division protease FtsH
MPNMKMFIAVFKSYITYKVFQYTMDQFSTNTKKAKDLEGKQEVKTFMDIGGCENAK